MHVAILSAFVLALVLPDSPGISLGGGAVFAAVGAYLLVTVALGIGNTRVSLRCLAEPNSPASGAARKHHALFLVTQLWLLIGLAGLILVGWGRWDWQQTVPLAGRLGTMAPFLVALLLVWILDYPFYRAMRRQIAEKRAAEGLSVRPGWRLGEYLDYNVRHYLLFVVVPVSLIVLAVDGLHLYLYPALPVRIAEPVVLAASALAAMGVFLFTPGIIVRIWKTGPLPPGPLRDRLENICRRLKLRYRQILVWRSGGMVANAGVMGIVGPLRYVLLSDALLEQMPERQIVAIFGHEAGHIVSRHIPYMLLFAISTVTIAGVTGALYVERLSAPAWAGDTLALGLLAATWTVAFGWLSRRFERQSDVMGAWAATGSEGDRGRISPEGAAIFSQALQRVADLNGIPSAQRNWRHGSIARRISYILWLGSTGGSLEGAARPVRRIKAALWAAVCAAAGMLALQLCL